jgi:hypothetical protein
VDGTRYQAAPLRTVGRVVECLHGEVTVDLPNPLVFANYSDAQMPAWRRWALTGNATRPASLLPIELVRLPSGTLVDAGQSYLTVAGHEVAAEQAAKWFTDLDEAGRRIEAKIGAAIAIDEPCFLLARFGETTWGHWIGDIFVRACVVEQLYPGRFRYVVPAHTTTATQERSFATSVLESLSLAGIAADRLIRLENHRLYRFAELYSVAGIRSDGMHPAALAALRALASKTLPSRRPKRVAALRGRGGKRAVYNLRDLAPILQQWEFSSVDLSSMSFGEQLASFSQAEMIVASLGSDCTSALFAPVGARIVTVSPIGWTDGYFVGFFQRLGIRQADVRGSSTLLGSIDVGEAAHVIDPSRFLSGLTAASEAGPIREGGCQVVDGEAVPTLLTSPVLDIRFGREGSAKPYCREGWNRPQREHRWSLGRECSIILPANALPRCDLWLLIEGLGHVLPPHMPTRPLTVRVNGTAVGSTELLAHPRILFLVPAARLAEAAEVHLTFEHPICPRPADLVGSPDERPIGLGFKRLAFFLARP